MTGHEQRPSGEEAIHFSNVDGEGGHDIEGKGIVGACDHGGQEPKITPPTAPVAARVATSVDEASVASGAGSGNKLNRRTFLKVFVGVGAAVLFGGEVQRGGTASAIGIPKGYGPVPYDRGVTSLAGDGSSLHAIKQHDHSSGSEGGGPDSKPTQAVGGASKELHASVAAGTDIDVSYASDHGWRIERHLGRQGSDFVTVSGDIDPVRDSGSRWTFAQDFTNADPASHLTFGAVNNKGLHVALMPSRSTNAKDASCFAVMDERGRKTSDLDWRGPIKNVKCTLAITPDVGGLDSAGDGGLEFGITLSNRPKITYNGDTIPAGRRQLLYRLVAPGSPQLKGQSRAYDYNGIEGYVYVAAEPGQTLNLVCDLENDIQACWPDMAADPLRASDNSLVNLHWGAYSTNGATPSGRFDAFRIDDSSYVQQDRAAMLAFNDQLGQHFATTDGRNLATLTGYEFSWWSQHFGAYLRPGSGLPPLPDLSEYNKLHHASSLPAYRAWLGSLGVGSVLSIYNHPAGSAYGAPKSVSEQDLIAQKVGYGLIMPSDGNAPLPCVGMEVYPNRAGLDAYGAEQLMVLAKVNGLPWRWLGASDDHGGNPNLNYFVNRTFSDPNNPLAGHFDALVAGRSWLAAARQFGGALDLRFGDDGLPAVSMGGVQIVGNKLSARPLQILATGLGDLPAGSTVDLVRALVNYAGLKPGLTPGSAELTPNMEVVQTFSPSDLGTAGIAELSVDTSDSYIYYLRVNTPDQAATSTGGQRRVGFSNPVTTLLTRPTGTVAGQPPAIPEWVTVEDLS